MWETWVRSLSREDPPGEGNGHPLQYSCLESPMDGGAWWATCSPWGPKELGTIERLHFHFLSQAALVVKNLPAADVRHAGSIPGSGRSPGEGHGSPLQDSCLGNPMDRVWWATVQRVSKSQTRLNDHAHKHNSYVRISA